MVSIAERELSAVDAEQGHTPAKGIKRFIKKVPLGVVLAISGTHFPMKIDRSVELPVVNSDLFSSLTKPHFNQRRFTGSLSRKRSHY